MITPAYSPTATERVLPRMALDFTTGVLDARVTVTRALNTATRVNSSGLVETVNANLPRFDYDPVTLAPRGLLIEEARANLLLRSAEFDVAPWFVDNVSVTANSTTAPDGTTTADAIIENLATSNHNVNATTTVTVAPHTFSVYAKPNGRSWLRLFVFQAGITANSTWFNVSTGVAGFASAGASNVSIRPAGNGWYRCSITFTPASAAAASFYVAVADADGSGSYAGNGTSGLFAWGAQAELGAFATSYIPTTTTSLTRNADAVSMTGTNFSDWFNANEGTLVVDASTFKPTTSAASAVVAEVNDGTLANRNALQYQSSNANARTVASGSIVVNITQAYTANVVNRLVYAFKTNSFAFAQNGTLAGSSVSGTNPTVDRLMIGSFSANTAPLNGHVSALRFYNIRLLNAETTAFSKG